MKANNSISKTANKMQKKRILIYSLTTLYIESPTPKKAGFVHTLNKELSKLGIRIKTITPHIKGSLVNESIDDTTIKRFRYLPEKYQINSLTIPEAINSKIGMFKTVVMTIVFFLYALKECLKEKPDILHGHWAFPGGYIAYLLAKLFRKKSIVTIHGSDLTLLKRFKLIKKFVVHGLNKSQVIANSNYTRDELIELGVNTYNIKIILVPTDFVKHEQTNEELKEFRRKITDNSSKIVLFVGRLVEVKGIEYLIKSLPEIKSQNIHLVIVGDGSLKNQLQNLTKSLELEEKVTFFGAANREELGLLHGVSDVLVCPSIVDSKGMTEHLGLVIPEAMESGLAIIATSVGGIVDTVKNEINGLLVEQKNPKAIANAIEKYFSDEELKKKMIENSKKTVLGFSSSTIAKKYYDIYQNILN